MSVITPFDPWKGPLCNCPNKYSLSPYTGCPHRCTYCYITSYIPHAFACRPKDNFLGRLRRDVHRMKLSRPVSMANSSDPYPPQERRLGLTRNALQILVDRGAKVLVITKSDLVARDQDVLRRGTCAVSFTITTLDEQEVKRLEPRAPPPSLRLHAIRCLTSSGIPCSVRIDPIIPGLNDDHEEIKHLVQRVAEAGAVHVVSSTYKARRDSFRRVADAFPHLRESLRELYWMRGEARGGTRYLHDKLRRNLMKSVKEVVEESGMTFATCREGYRDLHSGESCDGTHLIPDRRAGVGRLNSPSQLA